MSKYQNEFQILANRTELTNDEVNEAALTVTDSICSMNNLTKVHKNDHTGVFNWIIEGDFDGNETIKILVDELNAL